MSNAGGGKRTILPSQGELRATTLHHISAPPKKGTVATGTANEKFEQRWNNATRRALADSLFVRGDAQTVNGEWESQCRMPKMIQIYS